MVMAKSKNQIKVEKFFKSDIIKDYLTMSLIKGKYYIVNKNNRLLTWYPLTLASTVILVDCIIDNNNEDLKSSGLIRKKGVIILLLKQIHHEQAEETEGSKS